MHCFDGLVVVAWLALSSLSAGGDARAPHGLRPNLMAHPERVALADPKPRFPWIVRSQEQFVLNLELSANTTAKVCLPRRGADRVAVDGAARQARREGDFLVIEPVGSGKHRLEVR
jgi:hypothetical protein